MFVPAIRRNMIRLAMNLPDYLPADFQERRECVAVPLGYQGRDGVTVFPAVIVKPRPKKEGKSSAHRVFVVCPYCSREIPAGRWHQHVPVHHKHKGE